MVILIENPICYLLLQKGFKFIDGSFVLEKYSLDNILNYQFKTIENTGWKFIRRTYNFDEELVSSFSEFFDSEDPFLKEEISYILHEFNLL